MKFLVSILILLLLGLEVAVGQNDRWFRTRARVVNLEPVIKPDYAASSGDQCQQPDLSVASSMAQDIRQQEQKLTRQLDCETRTQANHRVVGYWVTYDYNGHEGRKYMSEKPGSWIPVMVSLEPQRTARRQR